MKILEGKPLGDKVIGVFECTCCQAKLEVLIKDCVVGTATDYSGDSDDYAGFTCLNCGEFQTKHKLPYGEIQKYHNVAKKIEEQRLARLPSSGDNEK
jgi:hypothetical protein